VDVGAEIDAPLFRGSSAYACFWGETIKELGEEIESRGMTAEEIGLAVTQANDPSRWLSGHAMITAWGKNHG
jgi:hypothetical protein